MRELNVCEVGAVAGGEQPDYSEPMWFGTTNYCGPLNGYSQQFAGLWVGVAREVGIGIAVEAGVQAISAAWTWATTPSAPPTYGNGNGATGSGYSGAGIGGNVSSGSTGSSHFG